jgi:hypothetical protein
MEVRAVAERINILAEERARPQREPACMRHLGL